MRAKILIIFLTTCIAFLGVYLRSSIEYTNYDLIFLILISCGVLAVEALLIWVISLLTGRAAVVSIVSASAIIFNFYCLRLTLIGAFGALSAALQITVLAGGIFVFYTLLSLIDEGRFKAGLVFAFVAMLALVDLAPAAWKGYRSTASATTPPSTKSAVAASNLQLVKFKRHPDVYIVAFDALMPRSLVRKYFGRDGFAYNTFLESRFRVFPNMFSDYSSTLNSLNSVLALDPEYFNNNKNRLAMFSGHEPSPLFEIFKSNGYITNTVFITHYFGNSSGPHVDKYSFHKHAFNICHFKRDNISVFTLFGYCHFVKSSGGKFLHFVLSGKKPSAIDFLLARFDLARQTNTPNIFVSYIWQPGHTDPNYRHADKEMRKKYEKFHSDNSQRTVQWIEKLLAFIDRQPGSAILILAGDHGPWLTRGMSAKSDLAFHVRDRYGIFGGIYPAGICKSAMDRASSAGFTTIMTVVRRLVECLSGGKDPFVRDVDYRIVEFTSKGLPDRFEEYLYE